ncbi:hypothetical protein ACFSL4_00650 [Streptomyces caeni]|uniref:Uncharacterized protein n=1 Tax=Streptomyces caeni TaxID=2307231 RepID=A0ABW4IHG8_9ACTN
MGTMVVDGESWPENGRAGRIETGEYAGAWLLLAAEIQHSWAFCISGDPRGTDIEHLRTGDFWVSDDDLPGVLADPVRPDVEHVSLRLFALVNRNPSDGVSVPRQAAFARRGAASWGHRPRERSREWGSVLWACRPEVPVPDVPGLSAGAASGGAPPLEEPGGACRASRRGERRLLEL